MLSKISLFAFRWGACYIAGFLFLCLLSSCKENVLDTSSEDSDTTLHIASFIPSAVSAEDTLRIVVKKRESLRFQAVLFSDSVAASPLRVQGDSIWVIVPEKAVSGTVSLKGDTTLISRRRLTVTAGEPHIDTVENNTAAWGNWIYLRGRRLPPSVQQVRVVFSPNIPATNILAGTQYISCMVPEGAQRGSIRFFVANKEYTLPDIYAGAPCFIKSIPSKELQRGEAFSISGEGFPVGNASLELLFDNGAKAIIDSIQPTILYARVPADAVSGLLCLKSNKRAVYSLKSVRIQPLAVEEIRWSELKEVLAEGSVITGIQYGSIVRTNLSISVPGFTPLDWNYGTHRDDSSMYFGFYHSDSNVEYTGGHNDSIRISYDSASALIKSITWSYTGGGSWTGKWGGGRKSSRRTMTFSKNIQLRYTMPKNIDIYFHGNELQGLVGEDIYSEHSTYQDSPTDIDTRTPVGNTLFDAQSTVHLRLVFK